MSSTPSVAPTSHTFHPPNATAQALNYNQSVHNGRTQQNGETHPTQTHVSTPPPNSHLGKNVNTTA